MYKLVLRRGIFAIGTGTFVYLNHQRYQSHTIFAAAASEQYGNVCENETLHRGRAMVPGDCAADGPLLLQLQQVQVLFRHGARTPLHNIAREKEVEYEPQLITREHQASLFPYEKVSCRTGCPIGWSDYEKNLARVPLKGGACAGALSAYGKDQMFLLGKTLRECYRDRLNLCHYDPDEVFVLSSNIRRTVESARCVLAGIYGKDELQLYAQTCQPLLIKVTEDCYNILVPDAFNCDVLKKVNHAAMIHPDLIPGLRDERLILESAIDKPREENMSRVKEAASKVDAQISCYEAEGGIKPGVPDVNEYHQLYLRDPLLYPLYKERGSAMEKVDRLWSNILARHRVLCDVITGPDMSVLIYLRRLEVEEFKTQFRWGYRFNFHFDSNPYFHNRLLVKEVYCNTNPKASPSMSTPIVWKTCGSVLPDICPSNETCQCNLQVTDMPEKKDYGQSKSCTCRPKTNKCNDLPKSFFSWFVELTYMNRDPVGMAIKDDIWPHPLIYLEGKRSLKDPWEHKLNFVFVRDDIVARTTQGWQYPPHLLKFKKRIDTNATKMMYYAMTGQHECERCIVSRLSAGPLLTALVDQAERHISEDKRAQKLCLYSTHDSTMTGLLEIFDIWDNKWPPFAADVRLELYKEVDGSEWYARLIYLGKVQRIRGQTEDFVHWCDFKKSIKKYIIRQEEFRKICCSDILEKVAKDLLKHDDYEAGERNVKPDVPAGM